MYFYCILLSYDVCLFVCLFVCVYFVVTLSFYQKIHSLVLDMVSKGLPLKAVNTILTMAQSVHQHSYSTVNIVKESLSSYTVLLEPAERYMCLYHLCYCVSLHNRHACTSARIHVNTHTHTHSDQYKETFLKIENILAAVCRQETDR